MELAVSANSTGMEFKMTPAGTFTMGIGNDTPNETPHEVTLTKPFKLGVHEVMQAQSEKVIGGSPNKFKGATNPVDKVSWDDAVEVCQKLSEQSVDEGSRQALSFTN